MRDSKATPLAHVQSVFHGHLTTFHFGGGRLAIKDLPNLHDTFTDFMTGQMEYSKMTDEQVEKIFGKTLLKYVQTKNELAL